MSLRAAVFSLAIVLLARDPVQAQTTGTRSVRQLLQTARQQSESGNAAGALESLRLARMIAPNSEEVLSAYAQLALAARMLLPAITTLDALTRICPTVAQHHYLMGVALMQAGDMPAAAEALQQADRLEPQRPLTLLALALASNSRKQYGEAKRVALNALELEPDNVDALAALAEAEAGNGELAQAADHAQRVLTRSPTNPTANFVNGVVLMKQERYADAREALTKAIAADPDSSAAHYQLSLAYARLGDDASAKKEVEVYQQKLRQIEERIKTLRATTGERAR
jgi:tetratricopeptide (TPR) repeat protein